MGPHLDDKAVYSRIVASLAGRMVHEGSFSGILCIVLPDTKFEISLSLFSLLYRRYTMTLALAFMKPEFPML